MIVSPAHSLVLALLFIIFLTCTALSFFFFLVRVFGRDAETSGRQNHQCPTITAASWCSACSLVVTSVLVSLPLSFIILFELGV